MSDLRKLAEACKRANDKMPHHRTMSDEKAWQDWDDAASPLVVLGLLDRIKELESANRACVDAVAEWGAKAGALQAEVDTAEVYAKKLYRERDEAREAVRRLAGALKESMSDDSIEAYGGALQALADPVVRRIVEGG